MDVRTVLEQPSPSGHQGRRQVWLKLWPLEGPKTPKFHNAWISVLVAKNWLKHLKPLTWRHIKFSDPAMAQHLNINVHLKRRSRADGSDMIRWSAPRWSDDPTPRNHSGFDFFEPHLFEYRTKNGQKKVESEENTSATDVETSKFCSKLVPVKSPRWSP